jgi:tetratricopeptide (TPR) repeat protein
MTGAVWRSAILAALFALHPLRVESVSWIAERKDMLSGFWLLVMLLAYTRYVERPSDGRYAQVLLAFVMGLASKPMMVTAPLLLLLLDYWPFRRVAVVEKVPMFLLAAGSMALTAVGQWRFGAMQWSAGIPISMRIANAGVSYARYLGKTAWPRHLAIFYPYPTSIPVWQVAGAFALLAVITAAAAWRGRTERFWITGWFWFLLALLPTIGLMQVGRQGMADRFTYIPLLGVFVVVVWGLAAIPPRAATIVAAITLVLFAVASWKQARTWRNSITVFQQAIAVTHENAFANHDLAVALESRGEIDAALAHYAEAVRIEPNYFIARYNYGAALLARGQKAKAAVQLREAVRYRPDYEDARRKLREIGDP